ncbi:MAG: glycosyltransferase family 9 protein [Candidatus Omnitrophica bacterium]|nr:glycosyltransferase family 9 protein [Candidatus Omnitrophota bacterium]
MKHILIVNPFGIGDVLFSTPLIAAIQKRWPACQVSYIANARTAPILRNDSRLANVMVYERDEFVAVYKRSPLRFVLKWKELTDEIRAARFDAAIDLSMGSPLGIALFLAGVPQRVGFNYKSRGRWLTRSLPLKGFEGRHVVEYNLDLLGLLETPALADVGRQHNGGNSELWAAAHNRSHRMSFVVTSSDSAWAEQFIRENRIEPGKMVGLYPGGGASWGAGAAVRRWAGENYAKLADKIVEKASANIILMGDKSDVQLCEEVARGMSVRPVIAAGKTTLGQAAALMQRCRLVVLNDGGAMHVAAASGVRTAVIFGPVDPRVYGPFPAEEHKTVVSNIACQPCYRNFRMSDCRHQQCLKQFTVEEVFQTIKEWL